MINAQRALIGQFVGGMIFALFAGQPLTIVASIFNLDTNQLNLSNLIFSFNSHCSLMFIYQNNL